MKLKTLVVLLCVLLLVVFSVPQLRRLFLSGIFKPRPPVHLTSDLPTLFNQDFEHQAKTILVRNVNLLPMNLDTIYRAVDVLIQDGIIKRIASNLVVDNRSDLQEIDGRKRYLIPGLTDMHTHINDEANLLMFLSQGVCMVRNMSGLEFHLELKQREFQGEILSPEILTTTPILEGPQSMWKNAPGSIKFDNLESIRPTVDSLLDMGYDEVKVYHTLSEGFWNEILNVAERRNTQVVGHIPLELSIDQFEKSYQASFEHISSRQMDRIIASFPLENKFSYLAEKGKWICPTLIVNKYMFSEGTSLELKKEYAQYVDRKTRTFWKFRTKKGASNYPRVVGLFKAFHEYSDLILSGTDCINAFVVPGISLHEELVELVASGMSNYEALRTSTYNPALYLNRLDEIGTLEEGKVARMVLLNKNPLDDINNTRDIAGVLMDGKWIDQEMINNILGKVKEQY